MLLVFRFRQGSSLVNETTLNMVGKLYFQGINGKIQMMVVPDSLV
jgi:hypothetical protein